MMRTRFLLYAAAVVIATSAAAQRPVSEPDDFVDPGMHDRSLFLSRLTMGFLANPSDHYRPLRGNAGFVLLTNSVYVNNLQFDYKHRESFGEDAEPLQRCDCPEPVYFPTPPPRNATPQAPAPGRSDTLQAAFYRVSDRATLRYTARWTRQELDAVVTSASTGRDVEHRSGHDQTFSIDADTHLVVAGHEFWGTAYLAHTSRSGMPDDRAQNELGYVFRPPGLAMRAILIRPKLTVGGISGRGAAGVNLVNPYLEAYWRHEKTKINAHLIASAEWTKTGLEGWRPNYQIAFFLDRTIHVKAFGRDDSKRTREPLE